MDVITAAVALAEYLDAEDITYLDILDALAASRLTLAPDDERETARAYLEAAEMEGALA